jgi:Arc/MetJ family transcription regulator
MATTRTNIELDDELVETAMHLYGTSTKRETVDLALRRLIVSQLGTRDALALEGTGWAGDLAELREDPPSAIT